MTEKLWLPSVRKAVDFSDDEEWLFNTLKKSSHQRRVRMVRNFLLDRAAQIKAQDMAEKNYFSHTSPQGISANHNVRATGYVLPDWYLDDKNNVESLYLGGNNSNDAAQAWLESPAHRVHVYGQDPFYAAQECVGIGKSVRQEKGASRYFYVFISAPCA